jgi:hypothetical protein
MPKSDISSSQLLKKVASLPIRERRRFIVKQNYKVFLYKYYSCSAPEYLSSIICDSNLWLSSPQSFNDPFDMKWVYTVNRNPAKRRERLKGILQNNPDLAQKTWKLRQRQIDQLMLDPEGLETRVMESSVKHAGAVGVCCLSQDPREILMWSHYADQHKGLVLQFDVSINPEVFLQAISVEYSADYPVVEWTDPQENALKVGLLRKFKSWCYEQERRIIRPGRANSLLPFKPSALTGIILGCRFPKEQLPVIEKILKGRELKGFPMPIIYSARQDRSSYGLKIFKRVN